MTSEEKTSGFQASYDPYDLWATPLGISVRRAFYEGGILGKIGAVAISLVDWFAPMLARRLLKAKPIQYPISIAQELLRIRVKGGQEMQSAQAMVAALLASKCEWPNLAWGLGFPWMSKNGLYSKETPFITHTPYAMEALIEFSKLPATHLETTEKFYQTWEFLESLKVMYSDEVKLALSYAPVVEPRIVVNANTYAALAYALHAVYGRKEIRGIAATKAEKLIAWVVEEQNDNGSWYYYADNERGNFIDCFHSCFVIKNLLKVNQLLPSLTPLLEPVLKSGFEYVEAAFLDNKSGLCRRFAAQSHKDLYRWDIYDQAEYLGVLIDFGMIDEAVRFRENVTKRFSRGDDWWCRIDVFGRRWGKNFLRWGIVPMAYQSARLDAAVNKGLICAE